MVRSGYGAKTMLHTSTQQLIRKLYELTGAGALVWKEGERDTTLLETEGYLVELGPAPPKVRLLRADGRELERADPDDLAAIEWPDGDGTFASRVTEMANRANRIARGAEPVSPKPLTAISTPPLNPRSVPRQPLASFGKTESFVKRPAPQPMMMSISARTVETPAQPKPAARPSGLDIYKPWK
jgi:hypothetical protein